ncbi:MAG TPA: hypothetical protein ENJ53_03510 [Phaeodactylibacter sp.]|nr:hypothetical protein [Phaeodactylibacter sp.]
MKNTYFLFTLLVVATMIISSCYYDNKQDLYDYKIVPGSGVPCEFTSVSFATDILPILDVQCNGACHNANDHLGNVILAQYNNVIPYVNNGKLLNSVNHSSGASAMPPGGQKIPSCEIDKLQAWVDDGAPNN